MPDMEAKMDEETRLTQAGAKIAACDQDHECTLLSCDNCLKELPSGDAIREEGEDYVAHFCGLDCLEAWRERHTREKKLAK